MKPFKLGGEQHPGGSFARTLLWLVVAVRTSFLAGAEPIKLHPDNPHYFLWRGKPTVLITSGEHYGAVLNRDFDYRKYLETLESHGFNLTRIFSGAYCEPPGAFDIRDNTLAPRKAALICPWARSDTPGYAFGGNKFDLMKWDAAYFRRLRDFVAEAGKRGVVVELVFFCPFYNDSMWNLSPMNTANNVNGIGNIRRQDVYTLQDEKLTAVQEAMVRRVLEELQGFDNVYYEICNEPYERAGQRDAWQARIAETIVTAEDGLPHRHLIAQNLPWRKQNLPGDGKKPKPVANVSILNFHGASSPQPVALYYDLNKVIAYDETGRGDNTKYRTEGWDFIIAGGAVYDHLDLSFTVGHEDATAKANLAWNGGPALHKQLEILKDFMNGFDFVRMKPDNSVIKGGIPPEASARALIEPGRAYAIYVKGGTQTNVVLELPPGSYKAEWVNTKTGDTKKAESFFHAGGEKTLSSPQYTEDIGLRVNRTRHNP